MKYQIMGRNAYMTNPIDIVLENRGIIDEEYRQLFLHPTPQVIHSHKLLKNIEKAVECLLKHLKKGSTIFIQIDPDVDGYTSSALLINYLKRVFPDVDIEVRVQEGKQHGIKNEWVEDYVDLVIVPDAGSNDIMEHKKLHNRGIDVIILDHHEFDTSGDNPYAIVVNNQDGQYPNKDFSGVGIVYKFCKELDLKLGIDLADEFIDLVALGNIADMMDTRNLETRYYILEGLKEENIKNPFIKALKEKQEYSLKGKFNIMSVAFYIAPLINATVRMGDMEEKTNMFKAFLETDEQMFYSYRGKEEWRPIAVEMARICTNVKARQGRARDKGFALIQERIAEKGLADNKILIVNATDMLDQTLTGLVAMQLVSEYKKPTILLRRMKDKDVKIEENGEEIVIPVFGGSARGYEKCSIRDFRQFCLDTGLFQLAQGHSNAFGIELTAENIIKANEMFNELLKDETFESVYDVDFAIPINELTKSIFRDLLEVNDLWGQGFGDCLVAITNIEIPTSTIELIGKSKNVLKFKIRDVEFVKFNSSEEEYEALTEGASVKMEVVGKLGVNEWNGETTPQVIIEDYNHKKSQNFIF